VATHPDKPYSLEKATSEERRYDPVMLQKVTALAQWLQSRQLEAERRRRNRTGCSGVGLVAVAHRSSLPGQRPGADYRFRSRSLGSVQ
jgi:hypothetical protein